MAEKQKIRIRLKAYDHEVIDQSARKIVETVLRTQATMRGPIRCPRRSTLHGHPLTAQGQGLARALRDAHPQAPARHPGASPKTVDSLQRIELPAGVDIEIKIQQA